MPSQTAEIAEMHEQVVVVTGASGGIGRAVAATFGARRASVGLLARGEEGLASAARDVRAGGGNALVIPTDVADQAQLFAAADQVENELGPIDVWVNVAFTSVFAPPFEKIHPPTCGANAALSPTTDWPAPNAHYQARTQPTEQAAAWTSPK